MSDDAEVVQPDAGQGDGSGAAPYQEWLDRIPEQVRGDVEPVFKDWDASVTKRFQDAAEYRRQWEPYEQTGVRNLSPEQVQWASQFMDAYDNNPQAIVEWAKEYANERGLTLAEAAQQAQEASERSEQSFDDYSVGYDTQALEKALQAQLGPIQQRLEAFASWQEQQEEAQRVQEANQFIRQQLDELKAQHGAEFDEDAVERFIPQYIESDPRNAVPNAWRDYQSLKAQLEKSFVSTKIGAPPAAESGGLADGSPEPVKTLDKANELARNILRQQHGFR